MEWAALSHDDMAAGRGRADRNVVTSRQLVEQNAGLTIPVCVCLF